MKTILVASDLSERSEAALERGMELATGLGAALKLHHVVDDALPPDIGETLRTQAGRRLAEKVETLAKGRDPRCGIEVAIGDVVESIDGAVRASGADLLVVGVHRRRVFLDQYRETTMERLIRTSRVPVLMVASGGTAAYAHLLGAIGLSRNCATAIALGREIAPKAKVTLFHAHEVSFRRESERDYADWQAGAGLPSDLPAPLFIEGRAEDVVRDLLAEGDYDLMTLGAHTRPGVGKLLLGGLAATLIRTPPCDLLIAK